MNENKIINELKNQLKKIKIEHKQEINKDTYWRGVMIGLETSINILKDTQETTTEDIMNITKLSIPIVKQKFSDFIAKQKNIDQEFVDIVNENFWDLF